MVLKPRTQARPPSQESKRSLRFEMVKPDICPDRLRKGERKLDQQKESRSTSRQFSSNSQSPQRCTTYFSPNPRQDSPISIPIFPSLSQSLPWDPYGLASVITVPPYRDNLYANSKTPSNSNVSGYKKSFSPIKYHVPVRDNPVRTKRKNIAEFVDQTTMTMARSSISSGSRHPVPALRDSDMFLPRSMLPVRNRQKKYDVFHYSTYELDKHPLCRTSSYLNPVATRPYYLSQTYLRPFQTSDTSIYSNQVTKHQCSPRQHCSRERKKVLYNEGIFESQTYRPKRQTLKTPPSTPRGRSSNRDHDKNNSPFLHNTESKYICISCRKPSRVATDFQPTTYHQQVFSGPQKGSKGIAWPKRVLQSEWDIDHFLCTAPAIFMAKHEPIRRTTCPHKFYGEL